MGLYAINCVNESCKTPFMWFSGNSIQLCEKCMKTAKVVTKKKEDASTNALGAMPNGRLIRRKSDKKKTTAKLINPLKGENVMKKSLAAKFTEILFEDEMPAAPDAALEAPADGDAPAVDDAPVDPAVEMAAACVELGDLVASMEDGEMKDKLMAVSDKLKSMCAPAEEPAADDVPADDGEPAADAE